MKKTKDPDSILLGRRIRTLRTVKGLTQQELGNKADVDYKFVGEIERGNMNPSFKVLVKISRVLDIELPEILRFEQETSDSKELQNRITKILKDLPVEKLQNVLMLLRVLYPIRWISQNVNEFCHRRTVLEEKRGRFYLNENMR